MITIVFQVGFSFCPFLFASALDFPSLVLALDSAYKFELNNDQTCINALSCFCKFESVLYLSTSGFEICEAP